MTTDLETRIRAAIRDVPDFPKPGIVFKDITPLLQNGALFKDLITTLGVRYRHEAIAQIVAIESRGFIFGAALAHELGIGLTLVRKPGKLPAQTAGIDYALEYGTDRLEIHADALSPGDRVLIVDDLLATGGTCSATIELVQELGAHVVEALFMIELSFLPGREALNDTPIYALTAY